ncbi:MAG TPA: hypothetical protein VFU46_02045 [Gemmatimonadales bacterium]|nr:hypothetical protein [Gemmatimonadales bacterium]
MVRLALVSSTGRRVADMTVAASAGGAYPQLVLAAPRVAVLAYTVSQGDRRAVRVVGIRIPA